MNAESETRRLVVALAAAIWLALALLAIPAALDHASLSAQPRVAGLIMIVGVIGLVAAPVRCGNYLRRRRRMLRSYVAGQERSDEVSQETLRVLRAPPKVREPTGAVLSSILFFCLLAPMGQSGALRLPAVLLTLVVHEIGHVGGLLSLGYTGLRIRFIPLFGVVTTGSKATAKSWEEPTIALLGPLPGILARESSFGSVPRGAK